MFAPRLTLALLLLPATLQAYAPYNTPTPTATAGDFTTANGGTNILPTSIQAPTNPNLYEIRTTLNIKSSGGTYITYLRATADALNSPTTANGTYYSIELQDVTVNGLTCTGNLAIYKTIAGSVTNLGGMAVPCKDGMPWRVTRNPNFIFISNDLGLFWYTNDADIATGQPGFGARNLNTAAGNGFASVTLWNFDQTPWNPVNTASIATSVAANEVDFQWQNATTPVGICGYQTYRNGVFMGGTSPGPTLVDHSVSPNTTYQYSIAAINCQGAQVTSAPFNVATPSPGGIDPRRTGVRANGAYWGGQGEQIDLLSGNLNFTLPLIRAQGRGGWGVNFALNYNSANFRKDTAATWKLDRPL